MASPQKGKRQEGAGIDVQRHLFQMVIENAPVGIAILRGPDFVFELVNPTYQAIAPEKEMLGRPAAEVWPEIAFKMGPVLQGVLRTGKPFDAVDRPFSIRRTPDGPLEERYFSFSYVPLDEAGDQAGSILVLATDTTEQVLSRKKIDELAKASQRRSAELQGVIDNMLDGVFVSDVEGRITLANEAAARMLGLDSVEELERPLAEFLDLLRVRHADQSVVHLRELPMARALAGEAVIQADQIIFNPKTHRDVHLRISAAPIHNEKGEIVAAVAVVRDVTKLTELDRLKDQFVDVAAHELKTPVTGIKGFAQLMIQREHEGISPEGIRALQAINRQADRIGRIVEDLLDISRLQLGRLDLSKDKINLADLVEVVADRMALITTAHQIRVVKADPIVAQGDQDRLEEALATLIDNAIKYSPKGGNIDVSVTVDGREAVISVKDYGVGIPHEKQPQIFQRFYRAHTSTPFDYGGMGIGLYISHEIIARHGGRMWFESEEGKGSVFCFSLPLA